MKENNLPMFSQGVFHLWTQLRYIFMSLNETGEESITGLKILILNRTTTRQARTTESEIIGASLSVGLDRHVHYVQSIQYILIESDKCDRE